MKAREWLYAQLALALNRKAAAEARKDAAKRVKAAFDGVEWDRHAFIVNGVELKASTGERVFYSAKEIDAAIERLNDVLRDLNK